jgi:hypothetical protein
MVKMLVIAMTNREFCCCLQMLALFGLLLIQLFSKTTSPLSHAESVPQTNNAAALHFVQHG